VGAIPGRLLVVEIDSVEERVELLLRIIEDVVLVEDAVRNGSDSFARGMEYDRVQCAQGRSCDRRRRKKWGPMWKKTSNVRGRRRGQLICFRRFADEAERIEQPRLTRS